MPSDIYSKKKTRGLCSNFFTGNISSEFNDTEDNEKLLKKPSDKDFFSKEKLIKSLKTKMKLIPRVKLQSSKKITTPNKQICLASQNRFPHRIHEQCKSTGNIKKFTDLSEKNYNKKINEVPHKPIQSKQIKFQAILSLRKNIKEPYSENKYMKRIKSVAKISSPIFHIKLNNKKNRLLSISNSSRTNNNEINKLSLANCKYIITVDDSHKNNEELSISQNEIKSHLRLLPNNKYNIKLVSTPRRLNQIEKSRDELIHNILECNLIIYNR